MEMGHLPKPSGAWQPAILALGDRSRLDSLIAGIGFASTRIEAVDMAWRFKNPAAYWDFLIELTALGPLVRSLPEASRQTVRAVIDDRLVPFTRADGVTLPSRCWCGVAIR